MDTKVILQAVRYLAKKLGKVSKLHAIKYLYFADKYHLLKYARMVTDDTYYAMKLGPVASNVKSILDCDFDSDEEKALFNLYLSRCESYNFRAATGDVELDMLSETDIEALDFALESFNPANTKKDIVEETHKYPEWKRFEHTITNEGSRREKVRIEDFFELSGEMSDPYLAIPHEIRELSKEFYLAG